MRTKKQQDDALLAASIYEALREDTPLHPEEVRENWRDEFLTNVIVPFLAHMHHHHSQLTEGEEPQYEPGTDEYGYARWAMGVLSDVVHILEEWRG